MDKKQYRINGEPSSAKEIITLARELDREFDESKFYQTSVGARILRLHGYTVDNNPNYNEET